VATGRDMLWSPTIRAALITGTPWLDISIRAAGHRAIAIFGRLTSVYPS
jgi:hypothetical protein